MSVLSCRPLSLLLVIVTACPLWANVAETRTPAHITVGMRMIGHALLLDAGDSTSLVLPIEEVQGKFRIAFGTDLGFVPERAASTIDSVIASLGMACSYVVEVVECDSGKVVYSYKIGAKNAWDIVPCTERALPNACYFLMIELLDEDLRSDGQGELPINNPSGPSGPTTWMLGLILVPVTGLVAFVFIRRRRKEIPRIAPTGVHLGIFRFDKEQLELSWNDQRMELSGKEADLLHLLLSRVNQTVEREVMLREVWGNEGDYVGRTLDVFISKLRKKLEADPTVRIVNIRGVGYRLILADHIAR